MNFRLMLMQCQLKFPLSTRSALGGHSGIWALGGHLGNWALGGHSKNTWMALEEQ